MGVWGVWGVVQGCVHPVGVCMYVCVSSKCVSIPFLQCRNQTLLNSRPRIHFNVWISHSQVSVWGVWMCVAVWNVLMHVCVDWCGCVGVVQGCVHPVGVCMYVCVSSKCVFIPFLQCRNQTLLNNRSKIHFNVWISHNQVSVLNYSV